jgi:hypothetical protein
MSPVCLPALLLAAGMVAVAAPRLARRPEPWSAKARERMVRLAIAALIVALAVALALSLVGAADSFSAITTWALASIAVAAVLIWRAWGSRSGSGAEPL